MLKPKRKFTRKEIKKDPLLEKISQIEFFVRSKPKQILYVVIAIVALSALSVLFIRSKTVANRQANTELGIAEMSFAQEDYDDVILRLESLTEKYKGTKSAGMATLLLAKSYYIKENFDKAEENYQIYIDDYSSDDLFLSSAYSGVAVCRELKGDSESAAENFEKSGNISPHKFQRHSNYLKSVRNYIKIDELNKAEMLLGVVMDDEPSYMDKTTAEILKSQIAVLRG